MGVWVMSRISWLILVLVGVSVLFAVFSIQAYAEEVDAVGYVSYVVDGDTFDVVVLNVSRDVPYCVKSLSPSIKIRIRLADIDTPEKYEPGYYEAKVALMSLVYGKTVYLDIDDFYCTDKYGRYIAVVYVPVNETHVLNVNKYLLNKGYAEIWDHRNEFNPYEWTLYIPKAEITSTYSPPTPSTAGQNTTTEWQLVSYAKWCLVSREHYVTPNSHETLLAIYDKEKTGYLTIVDLDGHIVYRVSASDIVSIEWSPIDENYLLVLHYTGILEKKGVLRIHNIKDNSSTTIINNIPLVFSEHPPRDKIIWLPDGRIAILNSSRTIIFYSWIAGGSWLDVLSKRPALINVVRLSSYANSIEAIGGNYIIAYGDGNVFIVNTRNYRVKTVELPDVSIEGIAVSDDRTFLVYGTHRISVSKRGYSIWLIDTETAKALWSDTWSLTTNSEARDAAFSPDGTHVAVVGYIENVGGILRIYDVENGDVVAAAEIQMGPYNVWWANNNVLVTCGYSKGEPVCAIYSFIDNRLESIGVFKLPTRIVEYLSSKNMLIGVKNVGSSYLGPYSICLYDLNNIVKIEVSTRPTSTTTIAETTSKTVTSTIARTPHKASMATPLTTITTITKTTTRTILLTRTYTTTIAVTKTYVTTSTSVITVSQTQEAFQTTTLIIAVPIALLVGIGIGFIVRRR